MSQNDFDGRSGSRLLSQLVSRDPEETGRAATPLELLFDLCFVVAIAQLAAGLHHAIAENHALEGARGFVMVFLAIWWAWMGFTWFASGFDNDDAAYRLKVLLQMIGVLVLAAGVKRAFEHQDFTLITLGYVIMRIGLVGMWLRVARADRSRRRNALRHAVGISVLQVLWLALLAVPVDLWLYGWAVLIALELSVPVWATRAGATAWHPHHIAERYGLLTIIVIGESVLAATLAIQSAVEVGRPSAAIVEVIVAAPVILFAMWWLYFSQPGHGVLVSTRLAFLWGYGHFFVFGSAAAVGAALAVAVDHATGTAHVSTLQSGLALSIPLASYLLSVWFVQVRPQPHGGVGGGAFPVAAAVCLAAAWTPFPTALCALTLVVATTAVVVAARPRPAAASLADP